MGIHVSGGVDDLARDLRFLATKTRPEMSKVVREAARTGNRHARAFASEEHTMFSDVDADYPDAFTVEAITPLSYEYGPDASRPQGSKASGYEFGSINQAYPHLDLARSADIVAAEFPMDVDDKVRELFAEAGFR